MMTATKPDIANLEAWYELDEELGTRADSHKGRDLTDYNSVGYRAGKIGNAASFNGTNNALYKANASWQNMSGGLTVAVWVKLDSITDSYPQLVAKGLNSAWQLFLLGASAFRAYVSVGSTGYDVDSITAPSTAVYRFVVMTYDNEVLKIYVDAGNPENINTSPSGVVDTASNSFLALGASGQTLTSNNFDGALDIVSLWSTAITQDEIEWLYNNGNGRYYSGFLNPLPDPIGIVCDLPIPSISLIDLRIKLRAAKRDVLLTAQDREKIS